MPIVSSERVLKKIILLSSVALEVGIREELFCGGEGVVCAGEGVVCAGGMGEDVVGVAGMGGGVVCAEGIGECVARVGCTKGTPLQDPTETVFCMVTSLPASIPPEVGIATSEPEDTGTSAQLTCGATSGKVVSVCMCVNAPVCERSDSADRSEAVNGELSAPSTLPSLCSSAFSALLEDTIVCVILLLLLGLHLRLLSC